MSNFRKNLMLLLMGFGSSTVFAQTEASDFTSTGRAVSTPFVTDYHALGINPANLDFSPVYEGKHYALGFLEIGASIYSEALTKTEVRQNLFRDEIQDFTQQEQIDFAREFANSANTVDIDVMQVGFAAQTAKFGAFGFSIRERFDYYSLLGPETSNILLLGFTAPYFENLVLSNGDTIPNSTDLPQSTLDDVVEGITSLANAKSISELLQGTHLKSSWIREFNLGWGKKILSDEDSWELYAGVGAKYLLGLAYLSVDAEGGDAVAFSALAPVFKVDYSEISANNPSDLGQDAPNFKPVGQGFGFDLGASLIIKEKLIASFAITDIGSITWDGNLYQLNDLDLTNFENDGIESVDFYEQIINLNGSDGLLSWNGKSSYKTSLPTTARFGLGYNANNKLRVGIDVIAPLNDGIAAYEKVVTAIGADLLVIPLIRVSAGFIQGGNYDFKIPLGITFNVGNGSWEAGIASRDIITFFSRNQPTISASLGVMRFRF